MVAKRGNKNLSSLPFPAIVGQEDLKRVLLATAVNDDLDGALIVGEKGTAKSTAVRGLVDLLPEQQVVADCPYGCAPDEPSLQCESCRERARDGLPIETRPVPLVTLPLGATRDRIVGTLSVEDALAGEADFDPGLLARAHRGILYVDEVNLLEDHLVDVVLDAAASGVNTVERDGISVSHPADFTLLGTMNPEEGDLRPQLRDRFALQATVEGSRDVEERVEILERALDTGSAADSHAEYADAVDRLRTDLLEARERLPRVALPAEFKTEIAELCLAAGVDGHRGDVAIARTAMTLAALEGRTTVIEPDVREAAEYALPHRLRATPFEDEPDLEEVLDDRFDEGADGDAESETADDGDHDDVGDDGAADAGNESSDTDSGGEPESSEGDSSTPGDRSQRGEDDPSGATGTDSSRDGRPEDDDSARTPPDSADSDAATGSEAGTAGGDDADTQDVDGPDEDADDPGDEDTDAQPLVPGQQRGEVVAAGDGAAPDLEHPEADDRASTGGGSRASTTPSVDNRGARVRTQSATGDGPIDAAASVRSAAASGRSRVEAQDLRQTVRTGETSVTIVFAVDASASMRPAMAAAKGVVLELLRDSYEYRDDVAFVAFAGDDAEVLLPPTDSVSLAARHLKDLPSADRTPLPAGLETAREVLERAETDASVVVLVTDGRANVADGSPTDATRQAARRLARTGASVLVVEAGTDSRAGLAGVVADETDGERVALEALSGDRVREAATRAADHR